MALLGSGPRSGLNELMLPENEPGSSIMPGKVQSNLRNKLNILGKSNTMWSNEYGLCLGNGKPFCYNYRWVQRKFWVKCLQAINY